MILDGRNRCQLWCCHIWMFYLWICQVQKLEGGNIGHLDGHYSEPLNVQILCENKTNYIFRLVETSQNHWRSKRNLHFSAVSGTLFSTSGVASLMLPLAWAFRASGKRPRENLMLLCSWKSCCSRWVPDLYFMAPQATFRRKRGLGFFLGGAGTREKSCQHEGFCALTFNFQVRDLSFQGQNLNLTFQNSLKWCFVLVCLSFGIRKLSNCSGDFVSTDIYQYHLLTLHQRYSDVKWLSYHRAETLVAGCSPSLQKNCNKKCVSIVSVWQQTNWNSSSNSVPLLFKCIISSFAE